MDHYFRERPDLPSRPRTFHFRVGARTLQFTADHGVFSKDGVDFGSALIIETVIVPQGARVLDLGAGYGAIGLSLAALYPHARLTLVEINARAVQLAAANARQNGLSNVRVLWSDGTHAVRGEAFDVVVTNPPIRAGKAVVFRLYREAADVLVAGGSLWTVVQQKHGADSHARALEAIFGAVTRVRRKKGYQILQAVKSE